jgi:hypothetical protein
MGDINSINGFIDTTSLYQIVIALHNRSEVDLTGWSAWDLEVPIHATALLVSSETFHVSPVPGSSAQASGPLGQIVDCLDGMGATLPAPVTSVHKRLALDSAYESHKRNIAEVSAVLRESFEGSADFRSWIRGHVAYAWVEHNLRIGSGLYEDSEPVLGLIARVTDMPKRDLLKCLAESRSEEVLKNYAKDAREGALPEDDRFLVLSRAYAASVIMRGRYYDDLARFAMTSPESRHHITLHPVRQTNLLGQPSEEPPQVFDAVAARTLAAIILNGAFSERGIDKRIKQWARNVQNARHAGVAKRMPRYVDYSDPDRPISRSLPPQRYGREDWATVRKLLREARIRLHPDWAEHLLESGVAYGGGLLVEVACTLHGFSPAIPSVVGTAASEAARRGLRKLNLGDDILGKLERRTAHLEEVSTFPPGRVEAKKLGIEPTT